jgi:hypothetical protein
MKSKKQRHIHLLMKEDLYEDLRTEAQRTGVPATAVVREAVSEYLTKKKREALEKEITEYAEKHAGTDVDLDPALEAASIEFLLEDEES